MKDKRSFSVVNVQNVDGCPTKFREGRYKSVSPLGAAKKAFSGLCNVKNIKGKCTFIVSMRETTQGSNKKEFTYRLQRTRLANPLVMFEGQPNEFTRYYETKGYSTERLPDCKPGRKRTRGRMSRKSKGRKVKKSSRLSLKRTNNKKGNNKKMSNKASLKRSPRRN